MNTLYNTLKKLVPAVLLIMTTFSCKTGSIPEKMQPNIVFIYADDWGYGDLGCHGSTFIQTPHLDQMAEEGIDFMNFSVNNPVCSPSRTALITGHFPARHSIHGHFSTVESHMRRGMPDWLDPDVTMLPRILKEAGYTTGHFGKWHLSNVRVPDAPSPLAYGYDDYDCFNVPGRFRQMDADSSIYKAITFIEQVQEQPFFVNIWIHATHTPHYPKQKFLEQYEHLEEQQQVYAAVASEADERIGLLFDRLEELGLDENTLVIFSSDNGPEFTGTKDRSNWMEDASTGPGYGTYYSVGETGGLKGRKRSLFAGGVRTPFIVRWPGVVPPGKTDSTSVITAVDMLPTLAELAGANLPEGYVPDGESVVSAFKGEAFEREKAIFWQWKYPRFNRDNHWPTAGIREGEWKLLVNRDSGKNELYNIVNDWAETNDLADTYPQVVEELSAKITDWEKTLPVAPPESCMSAERSADQVNSR